MAWLCTSTSRRPTCPTCSRGPSREGGGEGGARGGPSRKGGGRGEQGGVHHVRGGWRGGSEGGSITCVCGGGPRLEGGVGTGDHLVSLEQQPAMEAGEGSRGWGTMRRAGGMQERAGRQGRGGTPDPLPPCPLPPPCSHMAPLTLCLLPPSSPCPPQSHGT